MSDGLSAKFQAWWCGDEPTPTQGECGGWHREKRIAYGAYRAGRRDMAAERDALAAEVARLRARDEARTGEISAALCDRIRVLEAEVAQGKAPTPPPLDPERDALREKAP